MRLAAFFFLLLLENLSPSCVFPSCPPGVSAGAHPSYVILIIIILYWRVLGQSIRGLQSEGPKQSVFQSLFFMVTAKLIKILIDPLENTVMAPLLTAVGPAGV